MAEYIVQDTSLTAIADAVRFKTGGTDELSLDRIAALVRSNETGVKLPSLTTPVVSSEVFFGKEYIDSTGAKGTGTFTLDPELTTQETFLTQQAALLQQLRLALQGKAVSGGSGGVETIFPITSAAGLDGEYVMLGQTSTAWVALVKACDNIYSPYELIGKTFRFKTKDPDGATEEGDIGEGTITESMINVVGSNSYVVTLTPELPDLRIYVVHPSDAFIFAEAGINPGVYLAYMNIEITEGSSMGIFIEVDIEGRIGSTVLETCQVGLTVSAPVLMCFYGGISELGQTVLPMSFHVLPIMDEILEGEVTLTVDKGGVIMFIPQDDVQVFSATTTAIECYTDMSQGLPLFACRVTGNGAIVIE